MNLKHHLDDTILRLAARQINEPLCVVQAFVTFVLLNASHETLSSPTLITHAAVATECNEIALQNVASALHGTLHGWLMQKEQAEQTLEIQRFTPLTSTQRSQRCRQRKSVASALHSVASPPSTPPMVPPLIVSPPSLSPITPILSSPSLTPSSLTPSQNIKRCGDEILEEVGVQVGGEDAPQSRSGEAGMGGTEGGAMGIAEAEKNAQKLVKRAPPKVAAYTEAFEAFWLEYPTMERAKGSKAMAFDCYLRCLEITTDQQLINGVRKYADYLRHSGQYNSDATTWLNPKRRSWENDYSITFVAPAKKQDTRASNIQSGVDAVEFYRQRAMAGA